MTSQKLQQFGSNWTEDKLERVRKYLAAYVRVMKNRPDLTTAYIDAFAGTGYRTPKAKERIEEPLFSEFSEEGTSEFLDGSARIALHIKPRFNRYIFIEKDESRFADLQKLKIDYPDFQDDIIFIQEDSNRYLQNLCGGYSWKKHRAVLFLDPFGMQVEWNTIDAIAGTKAIDLWILFPLGVAVNRLLRKDGQINAAWQHRLNVMFGSSDWYDAFYQTKMTRDLFGEYVTTEKTGDFDTISRYFVDRLKTIFPGVAENPLPLYNSRNNPLYLLCFATANPNAVRTALNIANHILKG